MAGPFRIDEVGNAQLSLTVIPAQAGIQWRRTTIFAVTRVMILAKTIN